VRNRLADVVDPFPAPGRREHTEPEWIDPTPLPAGLAGVTGTLRHYLNGAMR
jgi:hypothetical protein